MNEPEIADAWLRKNWQLNTQTVDHAYATGIIGPHTWLERTREQWLAELDELIIQSVAATLTLHDALKLAP